MDEEHDTPTVNQTLSNARCRRGAVRGDAAKAALKKVTTLTAPPAAAAVCVNHQFTVVMPAIAISIVLTGNFCVGEGSRRTKIHSVICVREMNNKRGSVLVMVIHP